LPVLTWIAGAPVARMRSASTLVCWSPSITETGSVRRALAQRVDGGAQQRGLARAGAGHRLKARHAMRREVRAVVFGDAAFAPSTSASSWIARAWLMPGTDTRAAPAPKCRSCAGSPPPRCHRPGLAVPQPHTTHMPDSFSR
jgi:hypothetical protein